MSALAGLSDESGLAGFLLIPLIKVRYRQFVRLGGLIS
jgi:hypothetical protein